VYKQFYGFKEKPFQLVPELDSPYLSDKHRNALTCLQYGLTENMGIIIDEAQNLTAEALEAVRVLSNLKTENQALLQIMLVGESEIIDKIKNSRIRQLPQRIAVHYNLTGLDPKETGKYISFRLRQAG